MISHPCGFLADAFFNDTFYLNDDNGTTIEIDQANITTTYGRKRFKNLVNWESKQWINLEDGRLLK